MTMGTDLEALVDESMWLDLPYGLVGPILLFIVSTFPPEEQSISNDTEESGPMKRLTNDVLTEMKRIGAMHTTILFLYERTIVIYGVLITVAIIQIAALIASCLIARTKYATSTISNRQWKRFKINLFYSSRMAGLLTTLSLFSERKRIVVIIGVVLIILIIDLTALITTCLLPSSQVADSEDNDETTGWWFRIKQLTYMVRMHFFGEQLTNPRLLPAVPANEDILSPANKTPPTNIWQRLKTMLTDTDKPSRSLFNYFKSNKTCLPPNEIETGETNPFINV